MKRKNLLLLIVAVLTILMSVAFVACDENEVGCGSKHAWDDGVAIVEATCASGGKSLYTCTVCGKQKEVVTQRLQHQVVIDEATEPTCNATGLTEGSHCDLCGTVLSPQQELGMVDHKIVIDEAVAPACTTKGLTEGQHCLWCDEMTIKQEEVPATGHLHVKMEVDEEPTCDKIGAGHKVCADCGETLVSYEEIPAKGHTEGKWIEDIAPTCSIKGSRHQVCAVCEATLKVEEIECIPHTYDKEIITKNPTCKETGIQHKECVCGARLEDEIIDKYSHIPSDWIVTKDSTCTAEGSRHQVCLVCETEIAVEVVAKKAHTWSEWKTTKYADCENEGEKTRSCGVCDAFENAQIDKLGHTYGEFEIVKQPTCEAEGEKQQKCIVCSKTLKTATIPATGHAYGEWKVTTPATCTEMGVETRVCAHDEKHAETRELAMLAHTPGEWTIKTHATCQAEGEEHQLCKVCHTELHTNVLQKIDHTPGEFEEITPATCDTDGKKEQKCTVCHEVLQTLVITATGHQVGEESKVIVQPTCTTTGTALTKCLNCDKEFYTIIPENGHNNKVLEGVPATCLESGLEEGTECTVCGHIEQKVIPALGHDIQWQHSETEHWKGCTRCDHKESTPENHTMMTSPDSKEPTCTEDGYHASEVCEICGYRDNASVIHALGHSYSTEWTVDVEPTCETDGSQSHHCIRCGDKADVTPISAIGHKFGEWNVTTPATCTEEGVETRVCENDNSHKETRAISAKGHVEVVDEAVAPTCTATGLTEGKHCSACGVTLVKQQVVDALGHTEEVVPGKDATCTETGLTEGTKCSVCGVTLVEQKVIPALGHKEEVVPGKDATCTETGLTEGTKCSVCGVTLVKQTEIPANGHTYVWKHTETQHWQVCSVCGHTTDAVNHNEITWDEESATPPTCTTGGEKMGECVCGEIIIETTEPLGHSWDEGQVTTPATCSTKGVKTFTCSVCNGTKTEEVALNPNNHEYDEGQITTPATCSTKGVKTFTCKCGATRTEEVDYDSNNHDEKNIESIPGKAATCTATGLTEGKKCTACGTVVLAQEVIPTIAHTFETKSNPYCTWKECDVCKLTRISTEQVIVFNMGTDGSGTSESTSSKATYEETNGKYTLLLSNGSKFYPGCVIDGNGCVKLGSNSTIGSFTFVVPEGITSVRFYVGKYKANTTIVSINDGEPITIEKASVNGEYDCIEVAVPENREIRFATVSSGNRAVLNTIEYVISSESELCAEHTTWSDWKTVKEATCKEKGVQTHTCTVCGFVDGKETDFAKHTVDDITQWEKDENKHWHVCKVCGAKFDEVSHEAIKDEKGQAIYYATEDGSNQHYFTCSVCGQAYEKADHTPTLQEGTDKPVYGITENGLQHYLTCSVCQLAYGHEEHTYPDGTCVCGQTQLDDQQIADAVAGDLIGLVQEDLNNSETGLVELAKLYELPMSTDSMPTGFTVVWSVVDETHVKHDKTNNTIEPINQEATAIKVTLTCAVYNVDLSKNGSVSIDLTIPAKELPPEPTEQCVATFTLGADGAAGHVDGSSKSSYTETVGGYTLSLTNGTNFYTDAKDATGKGCIKLGSSKNVGSFTLVVPAGVTKVKFYVGKYKTKTTKVSINGGETKTITNASDNGEYDCLEVSISDSSAESTIVFTTVSGGVRAMLNAIEFYAMV